MKKDTYQMIVGLEVHVQLQTESKLFCGCRTTFGSSPNTQTCPICTGMPGTLPVLNRKALELSIKTGLAMNCEISRFSKWDRKNYFYPDLPKGYQISQFDLPICGPGWIAISDPKERFASKNIRLIRAHLEEDAGKSVHDEVAGSADTRIDLNRTGTPLLEIVSEPDIRSPLEARAYLTELKLMLEYLGVSDCNMQEGSLRVDANVNLHIEDEDSTVATPIVEIKNLNSFRAVERALEFESDRQWQQWQREGITLEQGAKTTRGWNDAEQKTTIQREKEDSADYRYFPDPDLVPVTISEEQVNTIRSSMNELPAALRNRLCKKHGLSDYDAEVIVNQGREFAEYFQSVADLSGSGKLAANWMQQGVLGYLKEKELAISSFPVSATRLGTLVRKIQDGELDNSRGKDVFEKLLQTDLEVEAIMKELGIEAVDDSALEAICQDLLAANPQVVEAYRGGKPQAIGPLIGQAKKKNPNANPGKVREILIGLIDG
ncbi:MAG: Asp-tRNA(Asn)/Glu-tRNA(Gln) amidotransferase subunit GatB [Planctomycetota bacterium]|nr:Asp-tRNA(Asn)/Glu-tRNA(Gln) amidotransferase subunit GatB [Planctomycetota bacterium]